HTADEVGENAVLRRVRLEHIHAAVVEPADDLHEQPGLVLLLEAGHSDEGGAVVLQRFVLRRAIELARVLKDKLALLRVAAFAVTGQAEAHADLRPRLVIEVVVHRGGTAGRRGWLLLIAANGGKPRNGGQNEG